MIQAVGALAVPALARRFADQRPIVVVSVALCLAGFAGIAWAPLATVWLWAVVLGLAQGALFATALALLGLRAHDAQAAAQLSGMAQGVGYVIAALGPLLLGALHDATGGWDVPMTAVLAVTAALAVPGWAAGRDRTVGAPTPPEPECAAPTRTH
jgi:CP family cyanate transporter-like MFS transporter